MIHQHVPMPSCGSACTLLRKSSCTRLRYNVGLSPLASPLLPMHMQQYHQQTYMGFVQACNNATLTGIWEVRLVCARGFVYAAMTKQPATCACEGPGTLGCPGMLPAGASPLSCGLPTMAALVCCICCATALTSHLRLQTETVTYTETVYNEVCVTIDSGLKLQMELHRTLVSNSLQR